MQKCRLHAVSHDQVINASQDFRHGQNFSLSQISAILHAKWKAFYVCVNGKRQEDHVTDFSRFGALGVWCPPRFNKRTRDFALYKREFFFRLVPTLITCQSYCVLCCPENISNYCRTTSKPEVMDLVRSASLRHMHKHNLKAVRLRIS